MKLWIHHFDDSGQHHILSCSSRSTRLRKTADPAGTKVYINFDIYNLLSQIDWFFTVYLCFVRLNLHQITCLSSHTGMVFSKHNFFRCIVRLSLWLNEMSRTSHSYRVTCWFRRILLNSDINDEKERCFIRIISIDDTYEKSCFNISGVIILQFNKSEF